MNYYSPRGLPPEEKRRRRNAYLRFKLFFPLAILFLVLMELGFIFLFSPRAYDVVLPFLVLDLFGFSFLYLVWSSQLKMKKEALGRTEGRFGGWRAIEGDKLVTYSEEDKKKKHEIAKLKNARYAAWRDDKHRMLIVVIPKEDLILQKEIAPMIKNPLVAINVDFEHVKDPKTFLNALSKFVKVEEKVWPKEKADEFHNMYLELNFRADPSRYERK
jgi:Zn-dependent protease with chaperone function